MSDYSNDIEIDVHGFYAVNVEAHYSISEATDGGSGILRPVKVVGATAELLHVNLGGLTIDREQFKTMTYGEDLLKQIEEAAADEWLNAYADVA